MVRPTSVLYGTSTRTGTKCTGTYRVSMRFIVHTNRYIRRTSVGHLSFRCLVSVPVGHTEDLLCYYFQPVEVTTVCIYSSVRCTVPVLPYDVLVQTGKGLYCTVGMRLN
jgi:hypothetical protein